MARDGFDALGDRADGWAGSLAAHPLRWTLGAIATLVVCWFALSWVLSWGGEAARVTGVTNVREQHTRVIEGWQALEAAAANACAAKQAENTPDSPTLVEGPGLAYAAQYRRIVVDYNRRQANLFEARLVGPKGYPRTAPTLADMQRRVC